MGENGHKLTQEERLAELEERKKRCETKLAEFAEWLKVTPDLNVASFRDEISEVIAFYMSQSSNSLVVILNPEVLLDMITIAIYGYWMGRTSLSKEEDKERYERQ